MITSDRETCGEKTAKPEASLSAQFAVAGLDRRVAVLQAEREREQLRQRRLAMQTSPHVDPRERIKIWEQRHAVLLPIAESHPLVIIIAQQTQLRVREIKDEQHRRRASEAGQVVSLEPKPSVATANEAHPLQPPRSN